MRLFTLALVFLLGIGECSIGENLPEYKTCVRECELTMNCRNVFGRRDTSYSSNSGSTAPQGQVVYNGELFRNNYQLPQIFLVFWSCSADCNYKCQQLITNMRELAGEPMVQFYGKWPFVRVLGMQEIFSVVYSIANFMVNYNCLFKILRQYNKNKKNGGNGFDVMYLEYLQLIVISLFGWTFSTLFHMRDNSVTETLDYYGAFAIVLLNFSAVFVRYMRVYESRFKWRMWKGLMLLIFVFHCLKLKNKWDYGYNTRVNLLFGILSTILWVLHSMRVRKQYLMNFIAYNNSIQLLPFEVKILTKLNYLGISRPKLIPVLPILLNIWLMVGMSFELLDFEPFARLLDAHAIWHLFTIFPPIIWYDWNIWDIEMMKLDENKIN